MKELDEMTNFPPIPAYRLSENYLQLTGQTAEQVIAKHHAKYAIPVIHAQEVKMPATPFEVPAPKPTAWVLNGLYLFEGDVYKAVQNKAKTGWYMMKLVHNSWDKKGKFVFAGYGFINKMTPDMLMDVAAAKKFAEDYFAAKQVGMCCQCGAVLTDPKSIAKAVGPVCEKKINGFWA